MDEAKGLRALPRVLVLALALEVVGAGLAITRTVTRGDAFDPWINYHLVTGGLAFAGWVLLTAGLAQLARRLAGREAALVRVAMSGVAAWVVLEVGWTWLWLFLHTESHTLELAYRYSWFVAKAIAPVALIAALWRRRRGAAIGSSLVLLVADPPPALAGPLLAGLPLSGKGAIVWQELMHLAVIAIIAVLAAALAPGAATPEPAAAAVGFRRIASALWLRVLAAVSVVGVTMLVMVGTNARGGVDLLRLAMLAGAAINILALLQLAVGVLGTTRAALPELGGGALPLAAAAVLWCAGVALDQLPYLYQMLYGDHDYGAGKLAQDFAQALAAAVPLVACGGIAHIAIAIARLAHHRGDRELREEAVGKGIGFVALMLASVAIQAWLLPSARSVSSFAVMSLCAAAAGLWGTVLIARLCGLAAAAAERAPGLPVATVVSDRA